MVVPINSDLNVEQDSTGRTPRCVPFRADSHHDVHRSINAYFARFLKAMFDEERYENSQMIDCTGCSTAWLSSMNCLCKTSHNSSPTGS